MLTVESYFGTPSLWGPSPGVEKVRRAWRRQRRFGEISHDLWRLTPVPAVELEGAAKQLLRAPGNRCVFGAWLVDELWLV